MTSKDKKQLKREKFVDENGIIFLDHVSMNYPEQGAPAIDDISLRICFHHR